MTDRPSIESLRAIVYGIKEPSTTEEIEALDAALSELAAYREREPKLIERAERAESALDVLQTWYGDHEEREAGCCPEDTRCTDYIGLLLDTLKMVDATVADLRTQRDESERQGDALKAKDAALAAAEEALKIHRDIMVQALTAEDDPDFVLEKTKSALAAIREARHD